MNQPSMIHLELSAKCNKDCPMCQRRQAEREAPDIVAKWGYMTMDLVERLSVELPESIVLSLHGRGEPLMYKDLALALGLLRSNGRILHFDSNIISLLEKADDVIGNLDILTVSLLEGNSYKSTVEQYNILREFLKLKGNRKPMVIIRKTGQIRLDPMWDYLGLPIVTRPLHSKGGRKGYSSSPTMPEFGICLEILNRLFIAYDGKVRPCVRYDIHEENVIGNLNDNRLGDIWGSVTRLSRLQEHVRGLRNGFCKECQYWGVPHG